MNLAEFHRKLIAAARSNPPSDRVPYAFEQRIMVRLRERPLVADVWGQWAGGLWRAAVPCVAVTVLLGAWAAFSPDNRSTSSDFSQELENTVLAAVDQEATTDSTW